MSTLQDLAERAQLYKEQHDKQELSDSEFSELISDLNIVESISNSIDTLADDEASCVFLMNMLKLVELLPR